MMPAECDGESTAEAVLSPYAEHIPAVKAGTAA